MRCKNALAREEIAYGLHRHCFDECFGKVEDIEFKDLDPKKSSTTSSRQHPEIKKQRNTFYHGVYLKYSARLGSIEYILKVEEPRYPELPLIEYLSNQIATALKIETPPYHLIDFNGRLAFATRNFMQDYTGTLVHIYNYLPEGEEKHNCEEIIKAILEQTGRLADVAKFIEICLFDSLIGNNDRHGRNLGIIVTSSMKKLAPMYDNPSCLGIEEDFFLVSDVNPSGSIWAGNSKHPKPADYIKEFRRLGYDDCVKKFIIKVITQTSNIINLVQNAILSQKRKEALIRLLQKRIGEFENGE
ncbi:MAG TPA: HipA domain-containing protein [Gammaproteobacteria bacterium]|nr:HipA domain-containing protein [Gammaproteobacteria bacterium]